MNLLNSISVRSIRQLEHVVSRLTHHSLVVLDIDDVVITTRDKIFRPLTQPIANHPMEPIYRLPAEKRADILSRIFSQTAFQLVEEHLPEWISKLQSRGVPVLGLTAFETPSYGIIRDTVTSRLKELAAFKIHFTHPRWPNGLIVFQEQFSSRPPHFKDGVLFSAPHAKGKVLDVFLRSIGFQPDTTLVIDDHMDNLSSIGEHLNATLVHYTGAFIEPCQVYLPLGEDQLNHFNQSGKWLGEAQIYQKKFPSSQRNAMLKLLFSPEFLAHPTLVTPYHWPDIDGIASTFAMVQLLKKWGYKHVRGMTAQTPQQEAQWVMTKLGVSFSRVEDWLGQEKDHEQVILVDVSDSKDLPPSFPLHRIRAVIDHRPYFDPKVMRHALPWIEPVGSAATLIGELYISQGIELDPTVAQLIYAAIMSNTIKLSTQNTTERDRWMASYLKHSASLNDQFVEDMFLAKSDLSQVSLYDRIDEDLSSKTQLIGPYSTAVAQLEIVGAQQLIQSRLPEIREILLKLKTDRKAEKIFFIVIDISTLKTYLVFEDEVIQSVVLSKFPFQKADGYYYVDRIVIRKEIIAAFMSKTSKL